jgi:hypothetical protein
MKLYISAGSQGIRTRKLFNELWLLESWTAKHGGSELVAVVTVMPFNSCAVAPGFGISAIVKFFKGNADVWAYMNCIFYFFENFKTQYSAAIFHAHAR